MLLDVDCDCLEVVTQLINKAARDNDLPHRFTAEDALVDTGLTSLAMVDLMFAVEAHFDLTIPDVELTPINFRCGETIAAMLTRVLRPGSLPRHLAERN